MAIRDRWKWEDFISGSDDREEVYYEPPKIEPTPPSVHERCRAAVRDPWKSEDINSDSDDPEEVYYEAPKLGPNAPSVHFDYHQHQIAHAPSVNAHLPKPTPRLGIYMASLVVSVFSIMLCLIPLIGVMAMPLYWLGLLLGGVGLIVAFVHRNGNGMAYALIGVVLSSGAWYMESIQQLAVQRAVSGAVATVDHTVNTVDRSGDAVGHASKGVNDTWEASKKKTTASEKAKIEKDELIKASEKTARAERENAERLASEKAKYDEARYRTWTSARGKFTTKAQLLSYANGIIIIETPEHQRIQVPLEKLSRADQDFVVKWRRQLERTASK